MECKVVIHQQFEIKFLKTMDYIGENFGARAALDFADEVELKINRLQIQPLVGMVTTKNAEVRRLKAGKYNAIFYRVIDNTVEILDLFDQRQHPDKSKY